MANVQLSLFEQLQRETPDLPDEALIRRLSERILAEAEAAPPVSVELLASLRGIVRVERHEQPWAGVLLPSLEGLVVRLRDSDSYERQRFTICHELSHTLFPGFSDSFQYRCNGKRTKLESRCDLVASELLLPRRFFQPDLLSAGFGLLAVEDLAARYEASIEATARRAVDLWPEPAALLVLRRRNKPSEEGREAECEPKLRLDYSHVNGNWPYLRRHKSVNGDSPLLRAFAGEDVREIGTVDELVSSGIGPVEIHARPYGKNRRVLALVRPIHPEQLNGGH